MNYKIGDKVIKSSGDYTYRGTVVSIFKKLSGVVRLVVENEDGMLFIFNENQLEPWSQEEEPQSEPPYWAKSNRGISK